MTLTKPPNVAENPAMSAKWDELTEGREFRESDAPVLALLCSWYAVLETCMEDVTVGDSVQVAYQNDVGDLKQLPQISTMKTASAEIRALNKQLGINDEARPEQPKKGATAIHVFRANRQSKSQAAHRAQTG